MYAGVPLVETRGACVTRLTVSFHYLTAEWTSEALRAVPWV